MVPQTASMLLDEKYCYRNRSVLVWACVWFGGGALIITNMLMMMYAAIGGNEESPLAAGSMAVLFLGVGIAFLWVGRRLLLAYRDRKLIVVQITDREVFVGDKMYPWHLIPWIGGKRQLPMLNRLVLCIGDPEVTHVGYEIPLNRSLTVQEFSKLMKEIEARVGIHFPSVCFGKIIDPGIKPISPPLPK